MTLLSESVWNVLEFIAKNLYKWQALRFGAEQKERCEPIFGGMILSEIFFRNLCVWFFFKTHGVYTRLCIQSTKTTWIDMIVGTMVQCFRYVTFIGRCGSFGVFQIRMGFYLWIIVVSFISCHFWDKNLFCMFFWDPNGSLFGHNGVKFCVLPFLGHNSISYFFQIRMWVYVSIMV